MSLSSIGAAPAATPTATGSANTSTAGDDSFARVLQGEAPAPATQSGGAPPQKADAGSKRAETPAREDQGKSSTSARSPASEADGEKAAAAAPAAAAESSTDKPEPAAATDSGWPPPGLASLLDPAALATPVAATTTTPAPAMTTAGDAANGTGSGGPALLRAGSLVPDQAGAAANPAAGATASAAAKPVADTPAATAQPAETVAGLLKAADGVRADMTQAATAAADTAATATPFVLPQVAGSSPATPAHAAPPLSNPNAPVPQLHGEAFADDIGTHVHWLAEQKIGHAHIRISPQELGPVEIRLQLDGDRISADFSSAQPEVRQALESSLPRLREMLGQSGFQLAHAGVGQQSRQDGNGGRGPSTGGVTGGDDTGEAAAPVPTRLATRGLLDAYA